MEKEQGRCRGLLVTGWVCWFVLPTGSRQSQLEGREGISLGLGVLGLPGELGQLLTAGSRALLRALGCLVPAAGPGSLQTPLLSPAPRSHPAVRSVTVGSKGCVQDKVPKRSLCPDTGSEPTDEGRAPSRAAPRCEHSAARSRPAPLGS